MFCFGIFVYLLDSDLTQLVFVNLVLILILDSDLTQKKFKFLVRVENPVAEDESLASSPSQYQPTFLIGFNFPVGTGRPKDVLKMSLKTFQRLKDVFKTSSGLPLGRLMYQI